MIVLGMFILAPLNPLPQPNDSDKRDPVDAQDAIESHILVESLMAKYEQEEERYVYNEALVNMPRGQMFTYELEFDADDSGPWNN